MRQKQPTLCEVLAEEDSALKAESFAFLSDISCVTQHNGFCLRPGERDVAVRQSTVDSFLIKGLHTWRLMGSYKWGYKHGIYSYNP